MCVICHKPKDVRFPDYELIDAMWEENPHGAGAMWYGDDGLVHWKKGFMTLKGFKRWVRKNIDWLEEVECALHFRITTHGGTSRGNCHPFVCDWNADPHLEQGKAECVLMHNGILPITPRSEDISDSAELALRIGQFVNPNDGLELLDEFIETGNRIITFSKVGTAFFGDKFKPMPDAKEYEKYKGLTFSNLNFEDTMSGCGWYGRGRGMGFFCDQDGRVSRFDGKREFRFGTAQEPLQSFVKPEGLPGEKLQPIAYDKKTQCFYNTLTNAVIPLKNVDPDSLSGEDYDIYQEAMVAKLKREEAEASNYDPELVEEARYYGMTVQEYLEYLGEYMKGDNN